jgi:hypothetical protein
MSQPSPVEMAWLKADQVAPGALQANPLDDQAVRLAGFPGNEFEEEPETCPPAEMPLPAGAQDMDGDKDKDSNSDKDSNTKTEEPPAKFQRLSDVNTSTHNRIVINKQGWVMVDHGDGVTGWVRDADYQEGTWIWTGQNMPRTRDMVTLFCPRSGSYRIVRDDPLPPVQTTVTH